MTINLSILKQVVELTDGSVDGNTLSLFHSLDEVLRSSHISTQNYEVFYKAVLRIAHEPGRSWTEKYCSLLNGLEAKLNKTDIGSTDENILSQFCAVRRRNTVTKTYVQWRIRYMRFLQQASVAGRINTRTLFRQAVGIWHTKWNENIRHIGKATETREKVLIMRAFNGWDKAAIRLTGLIKNIEITITLRRILRVWYRHCRQRLILPRLAFFWSKWSRKEKRCKNSRIQSQQHRASQVLYHFWKTWYLETCEKRAISYYDCRLGHKTFSVWSAAEDALIDIGTLAKASHSAQTLRKYQHSWRRNFNGLKWEYKDISRLHSLHTLARYFSSWRHAQYLNSILAYIEVTRQRILLRQIFRLWVQSTTLLHSASIFSLMRILRKQFYCWNGALRRKVLCDSFQRQQKNNTLKCWILQSRLTLLLRVRGKRLLWHNFDILHRKRRSWIEAEDIAKMLAVRSSDKRLLLKLFKFWRDARNTVGLLNDDARLFFSRFLISTHFRDWTKVSIEYTAKGNMGRIVSNGFKVRMFFNLWSKEFFKRKTEKCNQRLELALKSQSISRLLQLFDKWREVLTRIATLVLLANDRMHRRNVAFLSEICLTWWNKLAEGRGMQLTGLKLAHDTLLRYALRQWATSARHLSEMQTSAYRVFSTRSVRDMETSYERWFLRCLQVKSLNNQVELFTKRQQFKKRKTFFQSWLASSQETENSCGSGNLMTSAATEITPLRWRNRRV